MKPGRVVRKLGGINPPEGVWQTPWQSCISVGVWSSYIGDMAGVKVPLIAMKHAFVVSEKIEGIQNMPNVRDHDASVYLKLEGDALCIGGYEPNPVFWEQVSFIHHHYHHHHHHHYY